MDLKRRNELEEKLFTLMETTVDKLIDKAKGDPTAADFQAINTMLKNNKIDLEKAGNKGPDPDLPEEDDLPFTEGELVSL